MRVGIDISQLAYTGTGIAVYIEQLVSNLLNIDKRNEYILFGSSLRRQDSLNHFVSISHKKPLLKQCFYPLPQTVLTFLWNRLHTVSIERFIGKIDVFHTSDWLEPPAKSKKVTTIHDLLVYKYPDYMHPTIVANQRRKLEWVKKESDLIIVDSKATKEDVKEILDIEENRLRVVYLGVAEQFIPQSEKKINAVRKKYGIRKDYLLSIGSLEPRKNIERVIETYKILSQRKDLQLVIVGRHVWGKRLKSKKGIVFLESVGIEELAAFYTGAECFVYPSLYEGFGLPVLEAMKCGCPVVTSDRGSLKEVSGNIAVIVDPESIESIFEGINSVLESSESDYVNMVIKGFSWSKKFSWEKTAKETLEVYDEADAL